MIGILGGRDMPDATRRILSKLISFDLSLQLTWVGSATKKAMRNYKQVIQLISGIFCFCTLYNVGAVILLLNVYLNPFGPNGYMSPRD